MVNKQPFVTLQSGLWEDCLLVIWGYLITVAEWIEHQTTNSWSGVRTHPGVTSKVVLEMLQTGLETSC